MGSSNTSFSVKNMRRLERPHCDWQITNVHLAVLIQTAQNEPQTRHDRQLGQTIRDLWKKKKTDSIALRNLRDCVGGWRGTASCRDHQDLTLQTRRNESMFLFDLATAMWRLSNASARLRRDQTPGSSTTKVRPGNDNIRARKSGALHCIAC